MCLCTIIGQVMTFLPSKITCNIPIIVIKIVAYKLKGAAILLTRFCLHGYSLNSHVDYFAYMFFH